MLGRAVRRDVEAAPVAHERQCAMDISARVQGVTGRADRPVTTFAGTSKGASDVDDRNSDRFTNVRRVSRYPPRTAPLSAPFSPADRRKSWICRYSNGSM